MFYNSLMMEDAASSNSDLEEYYLGTMKYCDVPPSEPSWGFNDISDHAFANLPYLEEVFLPNNITSIDAKAFVNCPNLKKITVTSTATEKLKTGAPWGAPATCQVIYDTKATSPRTRIISPITVPSHTTTPTPSNYRIAMLDLLNEMREHLNYINRPNFQLINNGGIGIFEEDSEKGWTQELIHKLYKTVDAVMVEDVFYGIDADYNMADDRATPKSISDEFITRMNETKANGLTMLCLDYCSSPANVTESLRRCDELGYVDYCSSSRELKVIETRPVPHENADNHYHVSDIKNYMVLLNSEKFTEIDSLTKSLAKTNYDCIIMDISDSNGVLSPEQLNRIRYKANGGRRLLICYMSLGEAEVYRAYWNKEWSNYIGDNKSAPDYVPWKKAVSKCDWIAQLNPEWEGNFKVKYWTDEWKTVLFGHKNSYLDLICERGFDGVFLDVIDAYEYFESKGKAGENTASNQKSNDDQFHEFFANVGLKPYALCGLMGNIFAESRMLPNNLENRFEKSLGMNDDEYTRAVDDGSYNNFVRDKAGYGLAQWTFWSRKDGLLKFAKERGVSIADMGMQLAYLWKELQQSIDIAKLNASQSIREASDYILHKFERPANQSEEVEIRRAGYGQEFYNKYYGQNESHHAP